MERVIDCPICYNTDQCFEEVQEKYSSYLCFNCGYMSDSRYEMGSLQLVDNLKKSPQLVQDNKFEDKKRLLSFLHVKRTLVRVLGSS